MGLDSTIRAGVATAKTVIGDLLVDVTHTSGRTIDVAGKLTGGTANTRKALVEYKVAKIRGRDGNDVLGRAKVTFFEDVAVNHADSIVLPDGTTGPILHIGGLADPNTSTSRYFVEVVLG